MIAEDFLMIDQIPSSWAGRIEKLEGPRTVVCPTPGRAPRWLPCSAAVFEGSLVFKDFNILHTGPLTLVNDNNNNVIFMATAKQKEVGQTNPVVGEEGNLLLLVNHRRLQLPLFL